MKAVRRVLFAVAGGMVTAALVALVEARAAGSSAPGSRGPAYGALVLADLGVLVPIAALLAAVVAAVSLFLEPARVKTVAEHAALVRAQPVLQRTRNAALAPLSVLGTLVWAVVMAHLARRVLAHGTPALAGLLLALGGMGGALAIASCVLAVLRPLRRVLAAGASRAPWLVDPMVTLNLALVVALGIFAWGIRTGDTGGDGGVLGIFGVLKRSELDLRPAVNLVAIALGAYLATAAFANRGTWLRVLGATAVVGALGALTLHEARALGNDAASARAVEHDAPLGSIALRTLRKATDRDKDGASALFGGGDCDDRDPRRSPAASEVPDNGLDEDCSGADLRMADTLATTAAHAVAAPVAPPAPAFPPDLNVIVITIDTLRTDVGFMGYARPVTPHLDALAEKGVVFDHAYAFASYTGKSIGPLFIGKYPSETKRDGGHFNTYLSANTTLAERLHAAGVRTFGAASHWYFMPWSGLSAGMDVWDLGARPGGGQGDTDTSVTSKEVSDVAIRLLKKPENTSRRFYAWFHYFDPHEQYMPHEGAPSFGTGNRADYDGEVWFTDKHVGRVLDYVASQPWGANTAIVVTADHGEAFGEHNMRWHGYELWEPLVHVPLLIYVPGLAPHHVTAKRSHVDLVPTVLDLMSVPPPPPGELSGVSDAIDLAAPAVGGKPYVYEERDVYLDMPAGPFTAMRQGLIHGPTPGMKLLRSDSGQYQLFDLASDPGEKEDLAADKEKLAPMVTAFQVKRASLKEIVVKPDTPPPSP